MRNAWPFALLSVALISIESATARAQAHTPGNEPPQPTVADETASRLPETCAGADNVDGRSQTNCSSERGAASPALVNPNEGGAEPTISVGEIDQTNFPLAICIALGREAMANDLPVEFFTRLIWQESRFNPRARIKSALLPNEPGEEFRRQIIGHRFATQGDTDGDCKVGLVDSTNRNGRLSAAVIWLD